MSLPTLPEVLKDVSPGVLLRDASDVRYRVQKLLPLGLRLRSIDGARDYTWDELVALDLTKIERDEKGPAARRLGDLKAEAESMGVDTSDLTKVADIEAALGRKLAELTGADVLEQIAPQLSADAKDLQDYDAEKPWLSEALLAKFWKNDDWIAEEKLDGVRLKLHLTPTGGRLDSRRPDTKTRRFSEKSDNFPYVRALRIPELEGTVIDTEGMLPVTSGNSPVSGKPFYGSCSISTACCNAGPESSKLIQDTLGIMQFYAFDVLRIKGEDVTHWPFSKRRAALEGIIDIIHRHRPETQDWLNVTSFAIGVDKLPFFHKIRETGGEGIIFKNILAPYEEGKRSKNWMKLKRFQEIDAYVTGYIPGEHGYEGLVGALELSVMIGGKEIGIASVSQFELEERKEMTAGDGSLKPEYLNRVVTFRGQELTKHGRFRHAIFVTWREDKSVDDCDGYEVKDELASLGLLKSDGSDSFL